MKLSQMVKLVMGEAGTEGKVLNSLPADTNVNRKYGELSTWDGMIAMVEGPVTDGRNVSMNENEIYTKKFFDPENLVRKYTVQFAQDVDDKK